MIGNEIAAAIVATSAILVVLGIVLFVMLIAFIILIGFWIWMTIDCIIRDFDTGGKRLLWLIILILFNWVGAIVYYFAVKRKDATIETNNVKPIINASKPARKKRK